MNINIKQMRKDVRKNIYDNKFSFYIKAVFLQLILSSIGSFLIRFVFQFILISSGLENLNIDNFFELFDNPLSISLLIMLFLLISVLIFIEFSALTLMVYFSYNDGFFSWSKNIRTAFMKWKKLRIRQLFFFIIYFILMIPLSNLGLSSIFSEKLSIPAFITGEISKTNIGKCALVILALICAYANLRLIFSIPLTVINNDSFSVNMKKSFDMTKKGKIKFLALLGTLQLIILIISSISISLLAFIFDMIDVSGNIPLYNTIFYTLMRIIIFFFVALTKVTMISVIVKVLMQQDDFSPDIKYSRDDKLKKRKVFATILSFTLIIVLGHEGYQMFSEPLNEKILVIAHRGYTQKAVENSIEALEAAAKIGADYVEVDILLTKDNKFVVMHDFNLKRLAGVNRKVQDMNFDEVAGLTIRQGKFKSKIVSFEEFVKKAKQLNIKLLVELKPHGGEPSNYVDIFIDEMKKLGVEKSYKVMSLDLNVMEELEEKEPQIETGYVIPMQFGIFAQTNVDFFAIENFSYNDVLNFQAKNDNKEVFVWTINDIDLMEKYIHKGISAIITDYPNVLKEEISNAKLSNSYFEKLYRLLNTGF